MTRVGIVARSRAARTGLEALLQGRDSLRVSSAAADPSSVRPGEHDVLLIELESDEDLFAFAASVDAPPVVLLSDAGADILRSGVRAILPRDASASQIAAAIEAAAAGLVAIHPAALDALLPPRPEIKEQAGQSLTPREIEVLRLLAEGAGNKAIAWRLGISEHTVKFHVASIFSKLNASSRTEAVTLGVRQGLILL